MEKDFDFNRIGKRMPYTAPQGFLDEIERNVLNEVKTEQAARTGKRLFRLRAIAGAAIAASVAILVLLNIRQPANQVDSFAKVEQAFSNLSCEDQAYMIETYQEDIFINE